LNTVAKPASRRARTLAVTSGKGGVGKTVIAANLGAAMARMGMKVLVLDGDLGLANLDVALNLPPHKTLHDVIAGKCSVGDALVPGPMGITVLQAGSGLIEYSCMTSPVQAALQRVFDEVVQRFDMVIVDTGAGISDVVLFTVSLAQEVLVVATPEPTSLADAYAVIKVLSSVQQRRQIRLLVNQARRLGDGRNVCAQLQQVVNRFVNPNLESAVRLDLLGEVPLDPAMREAIARRELLMQAQPGSLAATALLEAATRLARG
jgi:flagellar biosynthesis protein FlhG